MAETKEKSAGTTAKGLSLDTWAVIVALALAMLVRVGLIHKVFW